MRLSPIRIIRPLALLLSLAGSGMAEESLPALVKRIKPAVVTIVSYNPGKAMPSLGTGFFTAPDRVITARHVLAAADRAEARTADGATLRVLGILAEDRPRDLVLVQVEKPAKPPAVLELAPAPADPGERVFTIGTPLGLEWSVSEGVVSACRDVPGAGTVIQHTTQITVGSSGGAILNLRGQVVAIQTATITEGKNTISAGQGLNFAVVAQHAAGLKAGTLRPLAACERDLPDDWVPAITERLSKVSLSPLTSDDFQGAVAFFEDAVRRQPDEPDAWFRLGLCLEKTGQLKKAKVNYLKAVALRPTFGTALNNLGAIYNRERHYEAAVESLRKAVATDATLIESHNSLAIALYHLKRYPEAAAAVQQALKLNAKHADARYYLALCCCQQGQKKQAWEHHKLLKEIDPSRAEQLKAELEKIK